MQIVGPFGSLGIVVPAEGNSEVMSERQKVEALRNALAALGEAAERLEEHLGRVDPRGEIPHRPGKPVPAGADPA